MICMNKESEFMTKFKKVDLFNETLHLIVYPDEGLKTINQLYGLIEGDTIKIIIRKHQ